MSEFSLIGVPCKIFLFVCFISGSLHVAQVGGLHVNKILRLFLASSYDTSFLTFLYEELLFCFNFCFLVFFVFFSSCYEQG